MHCWPYNSNCNGQMGYHTRSTQTHLIPVRLWYRCNREAKSKEESLYIQQLNLVSTSLKRVLDAALDLLNEPPSKYTKSLLHIEFTFYGQSMGPFTLKNTILLYSADLLKINLQ